MNEKLRINMLYFSNIPKFPDVAVLPLVFLAVLITIAAGTAPSAQASSDLTKMFPFLEQRKKGPQPEDTLRAPFADPEIANETSPELPVNAVPLDKPHRNDALIGEWVATIVTESLATNNREFEAHLRTVRPHFTTAGFENFRQFMMSEDIQELLKARNLEMHNFVKDRPFLLNSAALQGRYRWLFEIPVVLTFLPPDVHDYKRQKPLNKEYTFHIQVGRAGEGHQDIDILIERWDIAR